MDTVLTRMLNIPQTPHVPPKKDQGEGRQLAIANDPRFAVSP
jgi:hypothetical protein